MDESTSPLKTAKPSRSEARGAKAQPTKPSKEAPGLREGTNSASRSKDGPATTKDEHNLSSQGSRGTGKTPTDYPQDKGRGRSRRLTGRTSSGERVKGKAVGQQQLPAGQAPESRASVSAGQSPSEGREAGTALVPSIPEKVLTAQTNSCKAASLKDKSLGVLSANIFFLTPCALT